MTRLSHFYKENTNGIIITLIFHIVVFAVLNLTQFKVKKEFKEPEIIIDFHEIPIETKLPENNNQESTVEGKYSDQLRTNTASSKSASQQNKTFNEQYQKELEEAQNLVKDVKKQLTKEIPTLDNLKMPEAPKADPNKMKDKLYSGDSNIEYFLENRYHVRLPIPVYLAEGGGKVKVIIIVDRLGNVMKAEPVIEANLSEQILSYAKTAALRTLFNPNPNAPAQQNGYIIYNFIPQYKI
jgi:hypothetical protein